MPLHLPAYRKSCAGFVNKVIYRYLLGFGILAIHSCTKIFDIDFLTKRIYLFCKSVELIHHLFKQLGFNVNDFHNNDILLSYTIILTQDRAYLYDLGYSVTYCHGKSALFIKNGIDQLVMKRNYPKR